MLGRRERPRRQIRRALCTALVAALAAALVTPVEAGLCVKRNGKVVFRQKKCKRTEAAFDLTAIVTPGEKGDAGPAGIAQPRLRAVDANGQRLPGVLNLYGQLLYQHDGVTFAIELFSDGFGRSRPRSLYFGTEDCAGPPLMHRFDEEKLYPDAFVRGTTAYSARCAASWRGPRARGREWARILQG